jgi:protocatechuate 3,4-dioxygenase beta subunit
MGAGLIVVCAVSWGVRAQQTPAPTVTRRISGRVVAADSSRPLRALVEAIPLRGGVPVRARAGADGRYVLADLSANEYRVTARSAGYVTLEFGQTQPPVPGRPVDLRIAVAFDEADFTLPRASAIEGALVDEFGDPAPGVDVQIARVEFVAGKRRLMPVSTPRRSRPTDDRGQFRIYGLPPGDYYVMALSGPFAADPTRAGFAPTFYPGTTSAIDAQPVRVGVGQDASGLSFALAPAPAATISGRVVGADGQPVPRIVLLLAQTHGGDVRAVVVARQTTTNTGEFQFENVPFGAYVLQAGGPPGFGSVEVAVDRPRLPDVSVVVRQRSTMRGTLVFEGDETRPPSARVRISSLPVDFVNGPLIGMPAQSRVNADGTFEVRGLAGIAVARAEAPAPWAMKRITWNGRDVTDEPFDFRAGDVDGVEIVLSTRLASVTGIAVDGTAPVADYSVIVFAQDPSRWTFPSRVVASARSTQEGRFAIGGLPPGDYFAVAVRYVQGLEWQDPQFLDAMRAHAVRLTLADGQSHTITLRPTPR